MYRVTCVHDANLRTLSCFDRRPRAVEVFGELNAFFAAHGDNRHEVSDDYGTTVVFRSTAPPVVLLLEDLTAALNGSVRRAVLQAAAQQKANREAAVGSGSGIMVPAKGGLPM